MDRSGNFKRGVVVMRCFICRRALPLISSLHSFGMSNDNDVADSDKVMYECEANKVLCEDKVNVNRPYINCISDLLFHIGELMIYLSLLKLDAVIYHGLVRSS